MKTLRKLILGETWTLPLGVACTIAIGALLDAGLGDGSWWHRGGGWALFVLLAATLAAAVRR
ncbi:MAG: hypothetical protein ACXVFN_18245 [Solirubrobacteraceae bacterium]